jgi:hypothetical protein
MLGNDWGIPDVLQLRQPLQAASCHAGKLDDVEETTVLPVLLTLVLLLSPWLPAIEPPWYAATELPVRGEVTFYGWGAMEWAYEHRLRLGQVPVCDPPACIGYVATLRPGDLGRRVWLQRPGLPAEGPFLVVDYAARKDFERLVQRGLVAEVDYETAQRWGMQRPLLDVLILAQPPHQMADSLPWPAVFSGPSRRPHRVWLPLLSREANSR